MLDRMKELGFSWATKAGISLGIDDLSAPKEKAPLCNGTRERTLDAEGRYGNGDITVVEKFLKVTGEWNKASEEVKDAAFDNFRINDPTNPVYMMANSGARGNVSQVRQLLAMRGLMADAQGRLIDVPVAHSLREGMTTTEMLISSHGARKGVIDTALGTAVAGYLYRRLDFAGSESVVRAHDCGTTETIPVFLREKGIYDDYVVETPLSERIRGRVLGAPIVHPETNEELYPKGHLVSVIESAEIEDQWKACKKAGMDVPPIHVRSVLRCKLRKGICATCYGEDLSQPGKLAKLGYAAGIIGAQSVGEPGTQLTMRTFHTGGAFEGSAGKGLQAKANGRVSVIAGDTKVRLTPDNAARAVGAWRRTAHGGVGCVLQKPAVLEVRGDEGTVVQSEELTVGSLLHVQDGDVVSFGQMMVQPGFKDPKVGDHNVDKIPKPIQAGEDGEILIVDADTDTSCLPEGSRLIWVLRCSRHSVRGTEGAAVNVQAGDLVPAGAQLAAEWSLELGREPGVPRILRLTPALESNPCLLRSSDWTKSSMDPTASDEAGSDQRFRSRYQACTDFDSFCIRGSVAEYQAVDTIGLVLRSRWVPPAKRVFSGYSRSQYLPQYAKHARHSPARASVYAYHGGVGSVKDGTMGIICSQSHNGPGLLCPVSQVVHPEHVVPYGGLVFPHEADGSKAVLWCAEDTHDTNILNESEFRYLQSRHGRRLGPGEKLIHARFDDDSEQVTHFFTARSSGVFCFYTACQHSKRKNALVKEDNGVLRFETWDRLSVEEYSGTSSAHCVLKQGVVFRAPSSAFDETWYAPVGEDADGWVHFHQKLVPKGVPFISKEYPKLKSDKSWRVVELLDDPRRSDECRVLVRPVQSVDLPEDPPPQLPSETQAMSTWLMAFSEAERVDSISPLALAYEIVCSVGRDVQEPHTVAVTPAPDETSTAPSGGALTAATPSSSSSKGGSALDKGNTDVSLARLWESGSLAVTQRTPARNFKVDVSLDKDWSKVPAVYHEPAASSGTEGKDVAHIVPWAQLTSTAGACVTKVSRGGEAEPTRRREEATTLSLLTPGDCVRVRCKSIPTVQLGQLVRQRDALSEGDVASVAGRVVSVELGGDQGDYVVTLQRGSAYLVTPEGEILVQSGRTVSKGELLGTEDLVIPKTSDIVQGIPRINALFEAKSDVVPPRLRQIFQECQDEGYRGLAAAKRASAQLQREIANEIQATYRDQGVRINSKHIEIIVQRMCNYCTVHQCPGGVLGQGKQVDYADVEDLMALSPSGVEDMRVIPVVLGITAVSKMGHKLMSMGFREFSKQLVETTLESKAVHPVNGIKENIMMGLPTQVGSNFGVVATVGKETLDDWTEGLVLNQIPERE